MLNSEREDPSYVFLHSFSGEDPRTLLSLLFHIGVYLLVDIYSIMPTRFLFE